MGVLLGRSPADVQVLVTCAVAVAPYGMSLSGPDISLDGMCLEAVSEETAGSDPSERLAIGVSEPLGLLGRWDRPIQSRTSPRPRGGPSCRLRTAACSPATSDEVAGRGADPAPSVARLLAGWNELPELASRLALHFPATWMDGWPLGGAGPTFGRGSEAGAPLASPFFSMSVPILAP